VAQDDDGTVLGQWYDQEFNEHGFIYKDGTYTSIDYPGAQSTFPSAITPAGLVVGGYLDSNYAEHGFEYSVTAKGKAVYTAINVPGGNNTIMSAAAPGGKLFGTTQGAGNATELFSYVQKTFTILLSTNTPIPTSASGNGIVAGYFAGSTYPSPTTAFTYAGGITTTLPVPSGQVSTIAYGVNNAGTVVGETVNSSYVDGGFVYSSNGTMTALNPPGAASSYLTAINNKGTITGIAYDKNYNQTAYSYIDGVFSPIAPPGGAAPGAQSINASGQVLGSYYGPDGAEAYLATPVP
jgi:hypothetical protein